MPAIIPMITGPSSAPCPRNATTDAMPIIQPGDTDTPLMKTAFNSLKSISEPNSRIIDRGGTPSTRASTTAVRVERPKRAPPQILHEARVSVTSSSSARLEPRERGGKAAGGH